MSAAMLIQLWGDTMLTIAVLVMAILLIRKPFARVFGPRLTYALWLVPALRLVLPPLPFAAPETPTAAASVATSDVLAIPIDSAMTAPVAATAPIWSVADALPLLFTVWAAGMTAVLVSAVLAHRRFCRIVRAGAVELEPIDGIRLLMSEAVDGPVAFGLLRRFVVVPQDFFVRYGRDERALAIDHELSHHRHGDLWANGAALLLLAAQWFNPFAWAAIRAFRFDQEAACDARVLTMVDDVADCGERDLRTAHYAKAIAKAAVGSRLSLAAPMAVHDNLQERLTMLTQTDISKGRSLIGRLLVGGTALAVLATTATLVPAGIASASAQDSDIPAPPAPPAPPEIADAPPAPEAPAAPHAERRVMIFTSKDGDEDATVSADGKKHAVHRFVVRERDKDGTGESHVMSWSSEDSAAPSARRFEFAMPGGLSRDDIMIALKEQGVTGKKAEAIADKLEAKRKARVISSAAPMPPMPPIPPVAALKAQAWQIETKDCADGKKPKAFVNRDEKDGANHSRVVMMGCGEGHADKTAHLAALKKARDRFAAAQSSEKMSAEVRAKVVAELDEAIAKLEKGDK